MTDQPLTFDLLLQFHRQIVVPDIERIVDSRLEPRFAQMNERFDFLVSHIDAIYGGFDRIE